MFVRRLFGALVVVGLALAAVAPAAGAATVTNTDDSGPGSLRQAIAEAAVGETITLPAGEYRLTSGELVIPQSLTLAGAGSGSTTIESRENFRVIRVTGAGTEVTISGMKIRNGHQAGNPALGGGILNEGAKLTVKEAAVVENAVNSPGSAGVARGGGIAVTDGTLTLVQADVSHNAVAANGGPGEPGGTANGGAVASLESTLTALGSTFIDNFVAARGGQVPSDPKQTGGFAAGGGIWTFGGSASVTASAIAENTTETLPGPGTSQSGINEGGGILIRANATITASTIDGNHLKGGTIARGGGIFIGGLETRLLGDTITDNTLEANGPVATGGNLAPGPKTSVAGTIVSGGVAPFGPNCDATVKSGGFNLESANDCGFDAVTDLAFKDPQLGPLQNAGGPTPTRPPSRTSPAVDAGSAFGRIVDQRVLARPIDFLAIPNATAPGADGSDIGAVELQPSPILRLGKLTKRPNGIALLKVTVPDPAAGTLKLSGAGLKTVSRAVAGGTATLKVETTGKARRALRLRGRRQVTIRVTYSPGAAAPVTVTRKSLLTQRHKHQPKRRH